MFDTLLFRECKHPTEVFLYQYDLLKTKKLIPEAMQAYEWLEIRLFLEEQARSKVNHCCKEVTIEDIYFELPKSIMQADCINEFILTEIDAEKSLLQIDPFIKNLLLYAFKKDVPYI